MGIKKRTKLGNNFINWVILQSSVPPNWRQVFFDVIFGIITPILCLWFDPVVFRTTIMGGPYLNNFQVFAYLTIPVGILILTVSLCFHFRMSAFLHAVMGGVMLFGSLYALAIGIILLPLSILAIMAVRVEGLFGFMPFLTAFVFLRSGLRTLRSGWKKEKRHAITAVTFCSICLVIGIPLLFQCQANSFIKRSIADISNGEEQKVVRTIEKMKQAFWCTDTLCYDHLVWAYHDLYIKNGVEPFWIAVAYEELTGRNINERLWITGLHAFLR